MAKVFKGILVFIIVVILVLFLIFTFFPSKMEIEFLSDVEILKKEKEYTDELIKEEDFKDLPSTLKEYIKRSGFIGKPKMNGMDMMFNSVDFKLGKDKSRMKLSYNLKESALSPKRIAFMKGSMFGVPFYGYDAYLNEKVHMAGELGKVIPLFKDTQEGLKKGILLEYISESIFMPTSLKKGYLKFEEIEDKKVKCTITHNKVTADAILTFNDNYELVKLEAIRPRALDNGTSEETPWEVTLEDYKTNSDGIKLPTHLKVQWDLMDGPLVYFDGAIDKVEFY